MVSYVIIFRLESSLVCLCWLSLKVIASFEVFDLSCFRQSFGKKLHFLTRIKRASWSTVYPLIRH